MRKFKHLETGAILVPNNKDVIEQLANSEYYEEVVTKATKEDTKKGTKATKEDTKDSIENAENQ